MTLIFSLVLFLALLALLAWYHRRSDSLSKSVFVGLLFGVVYGASMQALVSPDVASQAIEYINIIAAGYVSLLKMIIMPLILVSIIGAILKVQNASSLGKISGLSIGILLGTTAVSALIGIAIASLFNLSADDIVQGTQELARGNALEDRLASVSTLSIADMIISFFPANPFADLAGSRPTSTIAVVIFSIFIGLSAVTLTQKKPELGNSFTHFMEVAQGLITILVRKVLALTPYGVLALMAKVLASSDLAAIHTLLNFVIASYVGLLVILAMHLLLVALVGVKPWDYLVKTAPALMFAFTSRSSAGTIPLNIETQITKLKNHPGVANFSASFGATMGQNGCAGLYPAMLAVMIAPSVGINPLDPSFIATLVLVVTVSSFGIAGVGGGATFAAIIVLSTLGMPVALAGLLISIEPLIDMGRTAINVSGAMTSGTVTSRVLGLSAEPTESDITANKSVS
ncbi:L-cystine transporter [Shewanella sp. NIFS-20-20]|uniref:L-cystine transporter n=1 Tax=Shewanella sp. NIFS-20-20 TaxID=2853806 RepID=UPI001C463FE4|nr:cation:dicarboxylase symporter family transporter [Shewanella sp. NIFS-20-20]MBV7316345.1 cation:dicarboxylase symporter family transporter [Shewanella sp. NIFS-20-20]